MIKLRLIQPSGNKKVVGLATYADVAPEIALVYAVLERAILDASGRLAMGSTAHRASGLAWLMTESEDDYHNPYSFVWCCQHVNADPGMARKRILKFIQGDKVKWGGRTTWQTIASMLSEEMPAAGDYDVYCEGEEIEPIGAYGEEEK